jgi:hypothetical protein
MKEGGLRVEAGDSVFAAAPDGPATRSGAPDAIISRCSHCRKPSARLRSVISDVTVRARGRPGTCRKFGFQPYGPAALGNTAVLNGSIRARPQDMRQRLCRSLGRVSVGAFPPIYIRVRATPLRNGLFIGKRSRVKEKPAEAYPVARSTVIVVCSTFVELQNARLGNHVIATLRQLNYTR